MICVWEHVSLKKELYLHCTSELLENILEEAGELQTRVPYEDLVTTQFAEEAVK